MHEAILCSAIFSATVMDVEQRVAIKLNHENHNMSIITHQSEWSVSQILHTQHTLCVKLCKNKQNDDSSVWPYKLVYRYMCRLSPLECITCRFRQGQRPPYCKKSTATTVLCNARLTVLFDTWCSSKMYSMVQVTTDDFNDDASNSVSEYSDS